MSKAKKFSLALLLLLWAASAQAQYYDWGPAPASVRWRVIKTPELKLIFPREGEMQARRLMWYLDTVRTHIDYGFPHGTMRTPVVLQAQNMSGNGMVMWAPKRMELLAAPASTYSEPWLKQLAIHEYRHNVQYNNLRQETNRPLMWLLGQHIAFVATGQFSIFLLEGDATMAETEFSAFGRGLQPSWTMHYRAAGDVGNPGYGADYWFSGSFRDYVPDHYKLGYQMVRWAYDRLGDGALGDVARYVARNPQFIIPVSYGLKRHYGIGFMDLFHRSMADLNAYWATLPRVEDSSERIATPETSYTTYRWPLWLDGDGTIAAFKNDLLSASRIVRVDAATGREKVLTRTGQVSSRPALGGSTIWWTEFRESLLWAERVHSRLVSYDTDSGRHRTYPSDDQIFHPCPLPDGSVAYVAYDYSGVFSIVREGQRVELPEGIEITGLAWDDATGNLYFIGLEDGGMFLGELPAGAAAFKRITPARHITISDLRAAGGKLYFGSIVSGKDEAHVRDLAAGTEYRLTNSTYGSFQPSTPNSEGRVALTTYDRHGYHLATQNTAAATPQEQRALPVDLVNPPWKRWNVPVMDSLVYTPEEAENSGRRHTTRRFSRILNIFQPHSWVPADLYPPRAISEADPTLNLGATIISQSLLSDAVSWLSYGWNRPHGSRLHGGLSYNGLGPTIDVEFTWGGAPQTNYTSIPQWVPGKPEKHLAVTTRLSLPMTVSSGRWFSTLTPSAEYNYNNGLIYIPVNDYSGNLTHGVERLTMALRYTGQTRMALSELQPRWGLTARMAHVSNPTNERFKSLWSASMSAYLPGLVRPHGVRVRAAWQKSTGPQSTIFSFQLKEVFPTGANYNFSAKQWFSTSADYSLPVLYPEAGLPGILYFKRVRLNLFVDYANWWNFPSKDNPTIRNRLYSYGANLTLDMNPLRLPATNHFSTTFTIAKPGDRAGIFFNVSLEMPL